MAKHNFVSNRGPQSGSNHRSNLKSPPKPKFQVESKSDNSKLVAGPQTHKSKFVPSKTGGLMAAIRVNGRIVFPDKKGPQPLNNGKDFEFQIIAENPKQTVYFAAVVLPETGPIRIEITKSGKMVCFGRKRVPTSFLSSKPGEKPLAEYRSASPGDAFEDDPEDFSFFRTDQQEVEEQEAESDDEDGSHVEDEAFLIFDTLRNKPVSCHSCGFEDCRCDGTGHDWVPYRTTVNVLA